MRTRLHEHHIDQHRAGRGRTDGKDRSIASAPAERAEHEPTRRASAGGGVVA